MQLHGLVLSRFVKKGCSCCYEYNGTQWQGPWLCFTRKKCNSQIKNPGKKTNVTKATMQQTIKTRQHASRHRYHHVEVVRVVKRNRLKGIVPVPDRWESRGVGTLPRASALHCDMVLKCRNMFTQLFVQLLLADAKNCKGLWHSYRVKA